MNRMIIMEMIFFFSEQFVRLFVCLFDNIVCPLNLKDIQQSTNNLMIIQKFRILSLNIEHSLIDKLSFTNRQKHFHCLFLLINE